VGASQDFKIMEDLAGGKNHKQMETKIFDSHLSRDIHEKADIMRAERLAREGPHAQTTLRLAGS
jgi:hypothetical protein